jgi:hypothetical protein
VYQDTSLVSGPYQLAYAGELGPARLKSEIPANTLPEGQYILEFTLELPDVKTPDVKRVAVSIIPPGAAVVLPTPTSPPTVTPLPTLAPTPTPEPSEPPPLELIIGIMVAFLLVAAAALGWWYRQLPTMLKFDLKASGNVLHSIGSAWGGKFAQTIPFTTGSGQKALLRFAPGALDEDGKPTTSVTLLSELEGTQLKVDSNRLWEKGDSAIIDAQSEKLIVGDETFDISSL